MIHLFEPCSDFLCYDIDINMDNFRNKYQYSMRDTNIDMDMKEESSLFYNVLKLMFYFLLGSFIMTLGISISTFIVMLNDKGDNRFDVDSEGGSESDSDSDSEEVNEKNYPFKYVDELKRLMNHCRDDEEEGDKGEGDSQSEEDEAGDENEVKMTELTQEEKIALSDRILMESTPKGNVVMYYNYDKEDEERSCFNYYCDNKSMPFNYLDTVSRKYVCSYKCPQLYRYLEKEIQEGIEKIKKMEELEKERIAKLESQCENGNSEDSNSRKRARADSVFATLKNYKKVSSVTTASGSNVKVLKSHLLVCKNRYKHLGTIEDYNETLRNKENQERVKEVKPISFSEFKQMNK